MKTVIRAHPVEENLYLETSPLASYKASLKNYLERREEINKYSIIRTPKLVIADIDCRTVYNNILSDFQDFTILKILRSLNALSTDKLESPPGIPSSIKLIVTIKASNILKLSATYFLNPKPINFKAISSANTIVKNKFIIVWNATNQFGASYCSIARVNVFIKIKMIMVFSNLGCSHKISTLFDKMINFGGFLQLHFFFFSFFFFLPATT